jgi:N-methylhydantoinase B
VLIRAGVETRLPAKTTIEVLPGDTISYRTCGGGGYGPPLERDAERVRTEVRDGVISRESAFEIFGVVLGDGEDPELDGEATAARRAELAATPVPVVLPEGPRAAAWVDDNLRAGDVYLENPTVA